jgi:hypothetical protein
LPFNDFSLTLGSGYFVRGNAASTWSIEGWAVTTPISLSLQIGWNSIGLPHSDGYTAESLCNEIIAEGVSAVEIDRWYAAGWDGHICGLPFNDFPIERGEGYFVKAGSAGTVAPAALASHAQNSDPVATTPPDALPERSVAVEEIKISNVRDAAVTISWLTAEAATGYLRFGNSSELGQVAYDKRGSTLVGYTHYVVLTGLAPQSSYFFDIVSGAGVDDNAGAHYSVSTSPQFDKVPESDSIYGQVFQSDGVTAAAGTIVYLTLMDDDGRGSSAQASLTSALVDAKGYWQANLGNARLSDGSGDGFAYSTAGDLVTLVAQAGANRFATQTVDTDVLRPAMALLLTPQQQDYQLYLPSIIR